jgi:signal transduction histidine kinase
MEQHALNFETHVLKTIQLASDQIFAALASTIMCAEMKGERSSLKQQSKKLSGLIRKHEQELKEYSALQTIEDSIHGSFDLESVFEQAAVAILKLSKADKCYIICADMRMRALQSWSAASKSTKKIRRLDPALFDLACDMNPRRATVSLNGSDSHRLSDESASYLNRKTVKRVDLIPLRYCTKHVGVIALTYSRSQNPLTPSEKRVFRNAATRVTKATEMANLYDKMKIYSEDLRERNEDLSVLFDLAREFSTTFDLQQTLRYAVNMFVARLDADRAAILIVDPEDENRIHIENAAKPGTGTPSYDVNQLMKDPTEFREYLRDGKIRIAEDLSKFEVKTSYSRKYFDKSNFKSAAAIPLISREHRLGLLFLGYVRDYKKFDEREKHLLETFGSLIATAAENCRLMDFISGKYRRAGWLTSKIFEAQEEERRKLAQDLHDHVGAGLTMLRINLQMVRKAVSTDDAVLRNELLDLDRKLGDTITVVRNLTVDLRPPMLDDLGLVPALTWYIEHFSKRFKIKIKFTNNFRFDDRFPDRETLIYRIVQETLTNIAKHAGASRAEIRITSRGSYCELTVADNGHGFDLRKLDKEGVRTGGFGLLSIRQQIDNRDGKFEIKSAPDKGTRLKVRMSWIQ